MAAVRDHGRPRVDHLSRLGAPSAVGLDETSFRAATPTHPTLLAPASSTSMPAASWTFCLLAAPLR
jgi:hypothetical protein